MLNEFRSTPFRCPRCGARYKVVRAEAAAPVNREVSCLSCGGPLIGREGGFVLKYFRVEAPTDTERRSA